MHAEGKRIQYASGGGTHTYPYIPEDPCGPARDHKQTCQDAKSAVNDDAPVSVKSVCMCCGTVNNVMQW